MASEVEAKPEALCKTPDDNQDSQVLTSPFHECRHITFDFTLLDEDRLPRNPSLDETEAIEKALPSPYSGIGVLGPFFVIYYQELPPKPWPISVAGLPLFLTTDIFGPWFFGRPARIRYRVLDHLSARYNSTLALYNAVIDFFREEQIPVTRIIWFMGCWSITVPDSVDISLLPGYICQTAAFYLSRETLIKLAPRNTDPRDDSCHSPPRPEPSGIPITSIRDPFSIRNFAPLTMDNPYTGLVDGQFLGVSLQRLPTPQHAKQQWVKQVCVWFGQDLDNIPVAGSRGSLITDSDGGLVCFFRYFLYNTFAIGVSAQELEHIAI